MAVRCVNKLMANGSCGFTSSGEEGKCPNCLAGMLKTIMEWKNNLRADGRIEYICEHGVGHPDVREEMYDEDIWEKIKGYVCIHGCDGCCERHDFPGRSVSK